MSVYRLLLLIGVVFLTGCAPLMNGDFGDREAADSAGVASSYSTEQPESQPDSQAEQHGLGQTRAELTVASLPRQTPYSSLAEEVESEIKNLRDTAEDTPSADLPIVINDQVKEQIEFFQKQCGRSFRKWLARSERYKGVMEEILSEYGLPRDLIYLAMIESGFNTNAVSPAKATGMWQFMPDTGRKYGLSITWYIDERRDPVKATHAAARYLKTLYEEFGCWYLALAAYNAGEGKIANAINRYKTNEYWELCDFRYLKRETKDFVPKILAAAIIAKNPEQYGFSDIRQMRPYEFDEVEVSGSISLKSLAHSSGCSYAELLALNPELIKKVVPAQDQGYVLKLPKDTREQAVAALERNVPKVQSSENMIRHTVRRGETLFNLAQAYETSVEEIAQLNNISRPSSIKAGQTIIVAVGSENLLPADNGNASPEPAASRKRIIHRVKAGDTLWRLSRKYGVAWKDLQKWNDLTSQKVLRPGDELTIYVKK